MFIEKAKKFARPFCLNGVKINDAFHQFRKLADKLVRESLQSNIAPILCKSRIRRNNYHNRPQFFRIKVAQYFYAPISLRPPSGF